MRCIITVGGADPGVRREELGSETVLARTRVFAADSGVAYARQLGLIPAVVVGDFDSARDDDLAWAAENGAELIAHRRDKDETDFDLALQLAMEHDPDEVVVIGVFGGRTDHFLANMAVVASPRFHQASIRAIDATTEVWVLHPPDQQVAVAAPKILPVKPGVTMSLLAWGGDAVVTTTGLRWNLTNAVLSWDASVGVSNEVLDASPTISVERGVVLAVVEKSPPATGAPFELER